MAKARVFVTTVARRSDVAGMTAGLVTVVLWGSAFVAIRVADKSLSPGTIALGRLVVSTAILSVVALVRREPLPARRDVLAIAAYGVLWLGVYSFTLNTAERHVDAGTSAMIINTGPLLIALLAGMFLGEGFPRRLFAGCAIAFGGGLLIGLGAIESGTRSGLGVGLCVVAAVAYASAVIVQKPVLARVSPFLVTWLGCAAATVACLPFAPMLVSQVVTSGTAAIGWVIYLGVAPTALGFATWAFALRRTSAGRTGALNYLIPVVAILLGWALLGEVPPWLAIAGGVVCLVGVYVARRTSGNRHGGAAEPRVGELAEQRVLVHGGRDVDVAVDPHSRLPPAEERVVSRDLGQHGEERGVEPQ
ncbi:MAG TPA: DMT family transporter [Streptosporangiaceae bacterium]|nr:DMT family transporter [Streptosporangiaceae bacterium]